jgi:hypothetical protein
MPGFGEMLSDNEMWQVSEMLARADKLPPATLAALQKLPTPPALQQPEAQPQPTGTKGRLTKKK